MTNQNPTLESRMKALLEESYTEAGDLPKDPSLRGKVIRLLYDHLRQAETTISDLKRTLSEQDEYITVLKGSMRVRTDGKGQVYIDLSNTRLDGGQLD